MTIESKKAVAVGNIKDIESICHTCAYRGCTTCPSLVPVRGRNEEIKDFPQVKKAIKLDNGKILVTSCENFLRISTKKVKTKTSFEWDARQRKFVKVIK